MTFKKFAFRTLNNNIFNNSDLDFFVIQSKKVGLGITDQFHGKMRSADIMMGRMINGKMVVEDRWAIYSGIPSMDTELGGQNNILEYNGGIFNGQRNVKFTRYLSTGDDATDRVFITGQPVQVIAAFNQDTDDLVGHGHNHGMATLTFSPSVSTTCVPEVFANNFSALGGNYLFYWNSFGKYLDACAVANGVGWVSALLSLLIIILCFHISKNFFFYFTD